MKLQVRSQIPGYKLAVADQTPMDEIRKLVRKLKMVKGWSEADIARQLGVPPKTFNDWLQVPPRTRCRHSLMLELALRALGLSRARG